MMPRTEACRQPHVYSGSLNSDMRSIYFAATGFPADIGRNPGGNQRTPQLARREISSSKETGIFNAIYLVGGE
jgi:hypothetical protein